MRRDRKEGEKNEKKQRKKKSRSHLNVLRGSRHLPAFFVSYVALNPGYFVFPLDLNATRKSQESEVISEGFSDPQYFPTSSLVLNNPSRTST